MNILSRLGYVALILATLPLIPVLWVPLRDTIGRPATVTLSTVLGLGGAWILLNVLRVLTRRKSWTGSPNAGVGRQCSAVAVFRRGRPFAGR